MFKCVCYGCTEFFHLPKMTKNSLEILSHTEYLSLDYYYYGFSIVGISSVAKHIYELNEQQTHHSFELVNTENSPHKRIFTMRVCLFLQLS